MILTSFLLCMSSMMCVTVADISEWRIQRELAAKDLPVEIDPESGVWHFLRGADESLALDRRSFAAHREGGYLWSIRWPALGNDAPPILTLHNVDCDPRSSWPVYRARLHVEPEADRTHVLEDLPVRAYRRPPARPTDSRMIDVVCERRWSGMPVRSGMFGLVRSVAARRR